MKISLSILTLDFANVEKTFVPLSNKVDYIHMDIMDAEFVPNISFGYSVVGALRKLTDKPFDTHLMMVHPQNYIEQFVKAGSQYITFHVEADCDVLKTIELIHSFGIKAGISIKPKTSVAEIEKYLPYVDMVLVMSVEPGFGGQKFMESSIEKIKKLNQIIEENGYDCLIEVDGGINQETANLVKEAGADILVAGSYIAKSENLSKSIKSLK